MATPDRRIGGISMGGILVIAGILIIVFWSLWLGLIRVTRQSAFNLQDPLVEGMVNSFALSCRSRP